MQLGGRYGDFLALVRLGIGNSNCNSLLKADWTGLMALAEQQGLMGVVLDGIEKLPETARPPKVQMLQWIGQAMQGYEQRYVDYCQAIASLSKFYSSHGFKMMVLKGYACSMNWPKPEHRPCGDIDIWQFGQYKEADATLAKGLGIEIDTSHHHHTVFYWRDFMVENHYDFVNVHAHRSSLEMEKEFKKLGQDDSHFCEVFGEKVYLPSPNLHALFLLRHAAGHFASEGLTMRQVIDWAFFVKANTDKIDWVWLNELLVKNGMKQFVECLNAICVEELGFEPELFPNIQFNPYLKGKVLKEVLAPEYTTDLPDNLVPRMVYKYKRWKANKWKRELCYNESDWDAFWTGVWAHIIKPRTI